MIRTRKFTFWLVLAFTTFFVGLGTALWFFTGNGTKNELVIAQEEPTKENMTYAIVVERFWKRTGGVYGAKDVWEIYGVKDFELNDDSIVDRFWFSLLVDDLMDEWMNRGNVKTTYGDRLFAEDVERALIDIPGCSLILTTDKPYRRLAKDNWWRLIVPHDREDTYDSDMLQCERAFLNELAQALDEKLDDELRALEDELDQLEKEGKFLAYALRAAQGYTELRLAATEGRFEITLLRFDSLLRWVTEETRVNLWEPIENATLEPGSATPVPSSTSTAGPSE